jgi:hypothetical protein
VRIRIRIPITEITSIFFLIPLQKVEVSSKVELELSFPFLRKCVILRNFALCAHRRTLKEFARSALRICWSFLYTYIMYIMYIVYVYYVYYCILYSMF